MLLPILLLFLVVFCVVAILADSGHFLSAGILSICVMSGLLLFSLLLVPENGPAPPSPFFPELGILPESPDPLTALLAALRLVGKVLLALIGIVGAVRVICLAVRAIRKRLPKSIATEIATLDQQYATKHQAFLTNASPQALTQETETPCPPNTNNSYY
jgi:hypothetical protein